MTIIDTINHRFTQGNGTLLNAFFIIESIKKVGIRLQEFFQVEELDEILSNAFLIVIIRRHVFTNRF
jgi:hypothetical protein